MCTRLCTSGLLHVWRRADVPDLRLRPLRRYAGAPSSNWAARTTGCGTALPGWLDGRTIACSATNMWTCLTNVISWELMKERGRCPAPPPIARLRHRCGKGRWAPSRARPRTSLVCARITPHAGVSGRREAVKVKNIRRCGNGRPAAAAFSLYFKEILC